MKLRVHSLGLEHDPHFIKYLGFLKHWVEIALGSIRHPIWRPGISGMALEFPQFQHLPNEAIWVAIRSQKDLQPNAKTSDRR